MKIASPLVGKRLEKLPRKAKPERRRTVLGLFCHADLFMGRLIEAAPNQMRPAAKINHTTRQALIHWNIRFSAQYLARPESRTIPPDAFFVAKRLQKRMAQNNPAILNRMMRIDFQVALAAQRQ